MEQAFIVLARALTRPVDLVVSPGEEDQRSEGRSARSAERQHPADEDEVIATIVQGMALALEMGQCAWDERHTRGAGDRLIAQPLAARRLGKPRGQAVLCFAENADAPHLRGLPGREA